MWLTCSGTASAASVASNPPPEWPTRTSPGCSSDDDRVPAIGQRRLLVDPRAVPGQVDGDAADDDQRSSRRQCPSQSGERRVAADVEDEVVPNRAGREVLRRVVDDVVGAERRHEVELRGAAHSGDIGGQGLGQLHRIASDSPGGTDDENSLPGLDPAGVGQGLQSRACRDRDDGGLLEGQVRGLGCQLVLSDGGVLGERPAGDAEHLVAHGEPGDRRPDFDDGAGDVEAGHAVLRPTESETDDPEQVGPTGHHVPGTSVETGGADVDEDLVVGDLGQGDVLQPQDVGRAVPVLDDRAHGVGLV